MTYYIEVIDNANKPLRCWFVAALVWGLNPGYMRQLTATEAGTLSGLLTYGTYLLDLRLKGTLRGWDYEA